MKRRTLQASGPRRRGRRPIPRLREKVLSSALELFGEKGFDHVLTDEVAARAGVGKGSVYRQFGSKEELYAAAVIEGFRQLRSQIGHALEAEASIPGRIAIIVRHTTSYFWNRGAFFALLRDPTALPPGPLKHFRNQREQLSLLLSQVLREGAAAGLIRGDLDFDLVAESVLGMIRGIRRHRRDHVKMEDAVDTVMALLFGGCLAPHRKNGARQKASRLTASLISR